jgi:hypothetical protein
MSHAYRSIADVASAEIDRSGFLKQVVIIQPRHPSEDIDLAGLGFFEDADGTLIIG